MERRYNLALRPTKEQDDILNALDLHDQNILVVARPGRGKTTTALLIAKHVIEKRMIDRYQQILFLTFSRNSVYQIKQTGSETLDIEIQRRLSIATYHSFMWKIISGFGRFNGVPPNLDLTGKAKAKAIKAAADELGVDNNRCFFSAREFHSISYDEFAPLTLNLLSKSGKLCKAISHRFPLIITDEFQDTNAEQWELIKIISNGSRLICFADPDQMIYSWRGACDDRLRQFVEECRAKTYPLQQKSMRTNEQELLNFAESVLDNKFESKLIREKYRNHFLKDYQYPNALGYHLKSIIREFYKDFRKRGSQKDYPTIALAAYSNRTAKVIQESLGRSTKGAPKTYKCSILQDEIDDSLGELIVHLSMWIAGGNNSELERSMQLIGGILTSEAPKADNPLVSLFFPKKLTNGSIKPRGTTKIIIEEFKSNKSPDVATAEAAVLEAVNIIKSLKTRVKSIDRAIQDTDIISCQNELIRLLEDKKGNSPLANLKNLREKLSEERLQRDILETILPIRGIVSSTLHKLKGREFDYVGIVTVHDDKLRSSGDSEKDARRLMYMALTRARYDARVLYIGSHPCFLLLPYI